MNGKRLPPRMHPDDLQALTEKLGLARCQIKHYLGIDDIEKRMEELASGQVEELRDELTG